MFGGRVPNAGIVEGRAGEEVDCGMEHEVKQLLLLYSTLRG
jgi:hypothetical protein